MTSETDLIAELKWCIENGSYGPRTGAVLAEALEFIESFVESVEREKGEVNQ
jgi:hypothetical protein